MLANILKNRIDLIGFIIIKIARWSFIWDNIGRKIKIKEENRVFIIKI